MDFFEDEFDSPAFKIPTKSAATKLKTETTPETQPAPEKVAVAEIAPTTAKPAPEKAEKPEEVEKTAKKAKPPQPVKAAAPKPVVEHSVTIKLIKPMVTRDEPPDLEVPIAVLEPAENAKPKVKAPDATKTAAENPESFGADPKLRYLRLIGWGLAVFLLFYLINAMLPLINTATSGVGLARWLAIVTLSLSAVLIVGVLVYALVIFCRIRRNANIFAKLNERDFDGKYFDLKSRLKKYLAETLNWGEYYRQNASVLEKHSDSAIEILQRLKRDQYDSDREWIGDFKAMQNILDQRASNIVSHYVKLVGIKTAISPYKLLDMACVIYNTGMVVIRIARIYNRPISKLGALKTACSFFLNVYISGELGAVAESIANSGADFMTNQLNVDIGEGDFSAYLLNSIPILGKFAGKSLEGCGNAFLLYRLGRRVRAEFLPLV